MSTFMHALFTSLDVRWREVDLLLDKAAAEELCPDLEFHHVLCRAAVVLIAAHLEGFVRDCAKAAVEDVNRFSSFKRCSDDIKRTFCGAFVGSDNSKESNQRVKKLMQMLDELNTKLTHDPFLFDGKNDDHKNPSPGVIERVCRNFGVKEVFALLVGSRLEVVFSGLPRDAQDLSRDLFTHLNAGLATFPYVLDPSLFGLDTRVRSATRSLWETFLDDLMKQRHKIAHGSSQNNGYSVAEIRVIKANVVVLQYGVMLVLCKELQ